MENQTLIIEKLISAIKPQLKEAYSVGALMYTPATNDFIYEKLKNKAFGDHFSLSLCLEDSIDDSAVLIGEQTIVTLFKKIAADQQLISDLPKLFIRVRYPEQIGKLCQALGSTAAYLKGFILPKFSLLNADLYLDQITKVNSCSAHKLYLMPILESCDIITPDVRCQLLSQLHQLLIKNKDLILNIRVGGNDLCNAFGVRRTVTQSIYDITPVKNIFGDIMSTFYQDFVLSGPVWEYFSDPEEDWKTGLENEIQLDLLNGFIGKTIIHPNQIPVVNECLKVSRQDLDDALDILTFHHSLRQVSKSARGTRMNEVKTHMNWAQKLLLLSNIYGVK